MFELGARPHAARALYRAYLEQSHVFVAIYFERYGWVAPGEEISGLEDEYRLSGGLPRLVYLKSPAPRARAAAGGPARHRPLGRHGLVQVLRVGGELERLLTEDLAVLLAERFLLGGPDASHAQGHPEAVSPASHPDSVNSLIGRTDELAEIERLVASGVRLITVVGPGGIGKTRLALEAARRAAEHHPERRGIRPARDRRRPGLPSCRPSPRRSGWVWTGACPFWRPWHVRSATVPFVLVLDNFEQVLPAATQVAELLSRCPEVTVVVTSRAALRIRAETLLPLGPLSLPSDEDSLGDSAAVQLFVERARAVRQGFSLDDPEDAAAVAELCRRLDGIPLALELAAGRSRLLPPRRAARPARLRARSWDGCG